MIYDPAPMAIVIFLLFVVGTVALSFYLGRRAKSSEGYFAAHGQIPWAVNGVAFAGDYLSAASFLGICGMIAAYGYDGFLYSIGFLAGWIVALFVIAEPMKRLGRFTFADALDANFDSRGIKAAAGVSTLVVSLFYLIPQMVGAGSLIQPLLGYPHWVGVVLVGAVVITIVVTAGMVSTTWVQFLKGSLLVIFTTVLVVMVLKNGFRVENGSFQIIGPIAADELNASQIDGRPVIPATDGWEDQPFVRLKSATEAGYDVFHVERTEGSDQVLLRQGQSVTGSGDDKYVDGAPSGVGEGERQLKPVGDLSRLPKRPIRIRPTRSHLLLHDPRRKRSDAVGKHGDPSRRRHQDHGLFPEANRGHSCVASGRASEVCRNSKWQDTRSVEFSLLDVGALLRNRLLAAHLDPLLHRQGRRGGPQEHDCWDCHDRFFLRSDALCGARSDDQWRARFDRLQHVGAPARS